MKAFFSKAFTLLEVLVALAITSLAAVMVAGEFAQMLDTSVSMRERTYASWIAQNKIAELRLANNLPEVSTTSGEVQYANTTWYWRAEITESGVENLFRVNVTVYYPDQDSKVRDVNGFIGEPVIPGQANRAWNSNVTRQSGRPGEER